MPHATRLTCGRRSVLESLETRAFMSVTSWSDSWLSDLSSNDDFGAICVGEDAYDGMASVYAGSGDTTLGTARAGWADSDDGSFDSGPVVAKLQVVSGESMAWDANGMETSFTAGSQTFSKVTIQAGVSSSGMRAEWDGVVIDFYTTSGSTTPAEEFDVPSLVADTFDQSDGSAKESIAVVTASQSGYAKVRVTGTVRLQAQSGVYPSGNDVFVVATAS